MEKNELQQIFPSLTLAPSRYTQMIKEHSVFSPDLENRFEIKILSNITLSPIKEILELTCWKNGINSHVSFGEYDNIVQESLTQTRTDCVVIFWELWNLFPNAASKLETLSEVEFDELQSQLVSDIELVIRSLNDSKLILFNRFSCTPCNRFDGFRGRFESLVDFANLTLESLNANNLQLIDLDQIHRFSSFDQTLDLRYLYKAKSLYTAHFFQHYASICCLSLLKLDGGAKKVLVLDCDNTLWKGVIGEDGFDNIDMASTSPIGAIFNDVQWMFKSLKERGTLICLCTKNNDTDINEILSSHSDLVLKRSDIVYIASNWRPKPENIIEITNSLNLGLDSIVFIDDSDFEIGLMREKLPDVLSLQVPKNLTQYPQFIRNLIGLFGTNRFTSEDKNRTAMYQAEAERNNLLQESNSIESYLESLEMTMTFNIDANKYRSRIAQMTQKTNQFNLTTKRMTEVDVMSYMSSENSLVASFALKDRYGDNGVTGACFVSIDGKTATIVNLLLSCRVLGRNAEVAFLTEVLNELNSRGVTKVIATYEASLKNNQVERFYDDFGFVSRGQVSSQHNYELDLSRWERKLIKHIGIIKDFDNGTTNFRNS